MCTLSEESSSSASQSSSPSSGVPLHVKFVLEWDMPAKSQVINDDTDQIEEHASVKQVRLQPLVVVDRYRSHGIFICWTILCYDFFAWYHIDDHNKSPRNTLNGSNKS